MNLFFEEKIEKKEKISFKPAFFLTIASCFMLFIFSPMEMYFTNKNDLWYDLYILAPVIICVFLIFTVVCILAFFVLYKWNGKLYQTALLFMFIFFICSYVQGNYLIGYLPVIDGSVINWVDYVQGRRESVVLWIVIVALVVLLFQKLHMERMYKVIQITSICMLLMFLVTLTTLCVANQGLENRSTINISTTVHEFEMSSDQNIIILLLDALDAGAFSDIVVGNEEYESVFNDFTYYENTLSAYPHTTFNIPFILSGMWFENKTSDNEYLKEVQTESPVFTELEERGFTIGLYDGDYNISNSAKDRFENVGSFKQKVFSKAAFARWQIKMTGMKYAPFDLKRFCVVEATTLEWLRCFESSGESFTGDNLQFYEQLMEEDVAYREDKSFKLIHLGGAHPPYVLDKNLNYLDEGGTFIQSVEASITLADIYLNKLKESGVYDNSVIIIMADHGNHHYNSGSYQQHPILLIKGFNEQHEFQIDDSPISFADLPDAYISLADGIPGGGQTVFDSLPQTRNRRFLFYDIKDPQHLVEYEQTGRAEDIGTMIPTGKEFNAQNE